MSPYVFTKSEGLTHVRLSVGKQDCIGHCETSVFEIIVQETRREVLAEVHAILDKSVVK